MFGFVRTVTTPVVVSLLNLRKEEAIAVQVLKISFNAFLLFRRRGELYRPWESTRRKAFALSVINRERVGSTVRLTSCRRIASNAHRHELCVRVLSKQPLHDAVVLISGQRAR